MNKEYRTLEEIADIRNGVGFHFTSDFIMPKILKEGLKPTLGANSSGGLGKEANDKTFISYGLEGVLQLYNRLLHASFQGKIKDLENPAHSPFIPEVARDRDNQMHLSMLEGFEMVRQYMESNRYIVFDCPVGEFSNPLSQEDIEEVNEKIKSENGNTLRKIDILDEVTEGLRKDNLSLQDIMEKLQKSINEKKGELAKEKDPKQQDKYKYKIEVKTVAQNVISRLTEDNRKDFLRSIPVERAELSNQIRENTLRYIQEKRGPVEGTKDKFVYDESDATIIDRVDFNEDKIRWYDQVTNPHNAHTRLVEKDGALKGIVIDNSRVSAYSKDGQTPANGLEFAQDLMELVESRDNIAINGDCELMTYFMEYLKLVEKYKEDGLLYTKDAQDIQLKNGVRHLGERLCLDLSNIGRYEGLQNFSDDLEKAYKDFEEEREKQKESKKTKENQTEKDLNENSIDIENITKNGLQEGITKDDVKEADKIISELQEHIRETTKEEGEMIH